MSIRRNLPELGRTAGAVAVLAFLAGRWSAQPAPAIGGASAVATIPAPVRPGAPPQLVASPGALAAALPGQWDAAGWSGLRAQPGTPGRNAELATRIEQLARTDPAWAIALAAGETNLILRGVLTQAALRGWADIAPAEAAKWSLTLADATQRGEAVETVFGRAAANDPAEAVRLGHAIFQQDPGGATGHACALAKALCAAGHFETAADLAADAGELGDVGRSILTVQAYAAWSRLQPEEAARAAARLANPVARTDALNAVVSGWGEADPAGLTQFVAQLPAAGVERAPLLGQALRQWANLDPSAATAWVRQNEANLGADESVAAIVSAGGFVPPETAAEWADGIANPELRSQTVLTLVRTWAGTDPDAAKRYLERTTALAAADRQQAAAVLAAPAGP